MAVVPEKLKNFQLRKVGFTTNFHAVEIPALHDFTRLFQPVPDIVPLHLMKHESTAQQEQMEVWQEKVDQLAPARLAPLQRLKSRNYSAGIRNFIRKEKPDALVMTRPETSFFNRLTGKSLLRAVFRQSSLPVFFIPEPSD